jgi:alpha-1,6-mannosyltransferase
MHICDLTQAYTETSGGIRTYHDAKRRYVLENTDAHYTLVIPGAEDSVERDGRSTTIQIASPFIPGAAPYRLFVRPGKLKAVLRDVAPDILEFTSLYTSPWVAQSYRKEAARGGHQCVISAYYFTDLPTAYVEPVARRLGGPVVGRWAKRQAARYVRSLFNHVDVAFTSYPQHRRLLRGIGVTVPIYNVPLGVDLDLFTPARRRDEVRARFGAGPDDLLLVYAGRFSGEKHVHVLVDALERLPAELNARMVLAGEGPRREEIVERAAHMAERYGEPRLFVQPYMHQKEDLAALLASSDVYVTAGPHETFGLSVVEAQAAGLPVVGVRASALIERVPPGTGLLGPVGDADAMAANIARVAAERGSMGEASRTLVRDTLSWDTCFRTIFEAYSSVVPALAPAPAALPAAA